MSKALAACRRKVNNDVCERGEGGIPPLLILNTPSPSLPFPPSWCTCLFLHVTQLSLKSLNAVDGHTKSYWFTFRNIRILTGKLRTRRQKSAAKSERKFRDRLKRAGGGRGEFGSALSWTQYSTLWLKELRHRNIFIKKETPKNYK